MTKYIVFQKNTTNIWNFEIKNAAFIELLRSYLIKDPSSMTYYITNITYEILP